MSLDWVKLFKFFNFRVHLILTTTDSSRR